MLIIPTWNLFNIIFYIFYSLTAIVLVYSSSRDLWMLQYSKFSMGTGLPSRTAMVILYALPIVAATIAAWPYLFSASAIQLIVYAAVTLHFAKRVLESLFLHTYSGKMETLSMMFIAAIYSIVAGFICYLNAQTIPAVDAWFYIGLVIFFVGETGNFYHHKLLVDLRIGSDGYHIPRGGFFEYVACPHYFFELVAWLGILFLSRHLFTLLALIAFTAYLTERSMKTRKWYQEKFAEYPKDRKSIIPFLI